jgi:hypothetical protein
MINKLIVDGMQIQLSEDDKIPYTYTFATSKTHTVKFALDETNEICAEAFKNCSNLTKINFPSQIKLIKRRAFENCSRLNNVVIPETIEYIGANAFDGCTSLSEMQFLAATPPQNYCEFPSNTICYIPTDSKYSKAENLDPDNEIYYKKSWYNQYTEVVGANLKLDGSEEYYKDNWVSIAPNNQTVEEKDRKPVDSIEFEIQTTRVTDPTVQYVTFTYTLTPEDTTNTNIYFQSSNEFVLNIVEDFSKPNQVTVEVAQRNGVADIYAYAESGAWGRTNVIVSGRVAATEAPTEPTEPEVKPDVLVCSMPNAESTITSVPTGKKVTFTDEETKESAEFDEYKFYMTATNGIKIECIISNWDEWMHYYNTCNVSEPDIVHFLNTKFCKELGVPEDSKLISKNEKAGTTVTEPRFVICDNAEFRVIVPTDVDVDYAIFHASGHNGAKSAIDYVYGHQDGVYINPKDMVAGSEGTTDITIAFRDKREEYVLFNGTLENCKKFWMSADFYKYGEGKTVELPPVENINPPVADEMYTTFESEWQKPQATGVKALSGICLAEDKSCLYGVSDTYGLYKINFDGTSELLYDTFDKEKNDTTLDMEGICIDENGDLYTCIENGSSHYDGKHLIKFMKSEGYNTPHDVSEVDRDKLNAVMQEFNNGFEGIGYEGGDTFFLGNQFKPITVTKYSVSEGVKDTITLGYDIIKGGTTEIGDLQYDPATNTLWVIDSRSSHVYNYDMEGNVIRAYKTNIGSASNAESFVIDFENKVMYVGCDNSGGDLYKFKFENIFVPETPTEPVTEPTTEPSIPDSSYDGSYDIQTLDLDEPNTGKGKTGEDYFA